MKMTIRKKEMKKERKTKRGKASWVPLRKSWPN